MFGPPSTAPISLPSPAIIGPAGANFVCATGVVNVLQFFAPPQPGDVTAQLTTLAGTTLPLVQTQPGLASGPTLATVSGSLATVCGNLTVAGGQVALDVRFVSPGTGPTAPGINPFLLLLLQLLLRGGAGRPGSC